MSVELSSCGNVHMSVSADLARGVMQEALHADSWKQQPTPQVLQAQKQTLDSLTALRSHAQQLLLQNEQAAEREQLSHGDLVVDTAGMGRLKALGDARVEALREGTLRAGLEQGLIWERLKELGWDSMEEHQSTLTGIKSSVEVKHHVSMLGNLWISCVHPKHTSC